MNTGQSFTETHPCLLCTPLCVYIQLISVFCTPCARSCVPAWRVCVGCLWSAVLCLLAGLQLEEFPPASRCSLASTESVPDILARVQQDQLPQEVTYGSHPVPSNLFRRKQSAPAAVTTAMSRLFSSGQRFGSGEYTGTLLRDFEELLTVRNPMYVHTLQ